MHEFEIAGMDEEICPGCDGEKKKEESVCIECTKEKILPYCPKDGIRTADHPRCGGLIQPRLGTKEYDRCCGAYFANAVSLHRRTGAVKITAFHTFFDTGYGLCSYCYEGTLEDE